MSNSSLVTYTKFSPNYTPRKGVIDTITIHCFVGHASLKRMGEVFAPTSKAASSNYGIDDDGNVGMFVEEHNRAWTTGGKDAKGNIIKVNGISGADNDHRAVTIEVASDITSPYKVTDKALQGLIKLVADIALRNNISTIRWAGDKSAVGKPQIQNLTVHRWFSTKVCPGDYLYGKMQEIADGANYLIITNKKPENPQIVHNDGKQRVTYRVRESWQSSDTQVGAFTVFDNAKAMCDALNTKPRYFVYDDSGNIIYPK